MYLTRFNAPTFPRRWDWLIDRLLHDTLGTTADVDRQSGASFIPKVNVSEDATGYGIHVEVPGLTKEEVKLELQDGRLTISGERRFNAERDEKKGETTWHIVEHSFGTFSRVFRVPEDANVSAIEASYNEGVLTVSIPKDEAKRAVKRIEVK